MSMLFSNISSIIFCLTFSPRILCLSSSVRIPAFQYKIFIIHSSIIFYPENSVHKIISVSLLQRRIHDLHLLLCLIDQAAAFF